MFDPTKLQKLDAKRLLKAVKAGDHGACDRARAFRRDMAGAPDADVSKRFTLLMARHAIARELGYRDWKALEADPPKPTSKPVTATPVPMKRSAATTTVRARTRRAALDPLSSLTKTLLGHTEWNDVVGELDRVNKRLLGIVPDEADFVRAAEAAIGGMTSKMLRFEPMVASEVAQLAMGRHGALVAAEVAQVVDPVSKVLGPIRKVLDPIHHATRLAKKLLGH